MTMCKQQSCDGFITRSTVGFREFRIEPIRLSWDFSRFYSDRLQCQLAHAWDRDLRCLRGCASFQSRAAPKLLAIAEHDEFRGGVFRGAIIHANGNRERGVKPMQG